MSFFKLETTTVIEERDFQAIYDHGQTTPLFRAWLIDPPIETQTDEMLFRAFEYAFRAPEYSTLIDEKTGNIFKLSMLWNKNWAERNKFSEYREPKFVYQLKPEDFYTFLFPDGEKQILNYKSALEALSIMLKCACDYPSICFYAPGEEIETITSWSLKVPEKYLVRVSTGKSQLVHEWHVWFMSEVIRLVLRISQEFFSDEDLLKIKTGEVFPIHHKTAQKCLKKLQEELIEKDIIVSKIESFTESMVISMIKKFLTGLVIG
ncbi:MAG: hypothetical protein ACFFCW_16105 [Candidatus Hodarchaeota archaeon]